MGVYFSDTTRRDERLAVTVGGRYNYAHIEIKNNGEIERGRDDPLYGHARLLPLQSDGGRHLQAAAGLTLYGGYAEANRAPTPAELACADPENPCLIESFLTADPPLEQVVWRTVEIGLRGKLASDGGEAQWGAGLFRTETSDDILAITSGTNGAHIFVNAGDTLRQGVELACDYQDSQLDRVCELRLHRCDVPHGEPHLARQVQRCRR